VDEDGDDLQGELVSIHAFINDKPAVHIKENDEILLRIENIGPRIEKPSVWFGKVCIWTADMLEEKSTFDITMNAGEYIGNTVVIIKDDKGHNICTPLIFGIEPRAYSLEEFHKIRHERIPLLLDKFGAENVFDEVYEGGTVKSKVEVVDFAVDELLNHYSRELIELSKDITKRLTYKSKRERRKYKSEIKGKIKWQKTLKLRSQKGLSRATSHVCERRKRTYGTPANLLLLKFHSELLTDGVMLLSRLQSKEIEKLRWKRIFKLEGTTEYDQKAVEMLSGLREVLPLHQIFLNQERFKDIMPLLRFIQRDNNQFIREAELEAQHAKNRSYKPLVDLYREFATNFQAIYLKTMTVDAQKMSDVYRLWLVCELANSFNLHSVARSMREFKDYNDTLYLYFQKIDTMFNPWSDGSEESMIYLGEEKEVIDPSFHGPEIYLIYDDIEVLVHTIYGEFTGGMSRKNVYEALAYMHDFGFKVGIVLYPGKRFHIKYDSVQKAPHILIEAPLFPKFIEGDLETERMNDYLRYVVKTAVDLYKMAKNKEDISGAVKNICKTIKAEHFADI
jgi:hypothetical protein